jgi:ComF family protein
VFSGPSGIRFGMKALRLPEFLKSSLEAGLGFFYPEVCQLCESRRATAAEGYVCQDCAGGVKRIEPPCCECCGRPFAGQITGTFVCSWCQETRIYYASARSAVDFGGVAKEVIHRYKYQQALWFEPLLAAWLNQSAVPELRAGGWDWLVPVPLHPLKRRERDFNQAENLARRLGEAAGIPLNVGLVERVENTPSQTHLTREERAANVRNAFALKTGVVLQGEKIVLVDDVMTTGATVNACARVLRKAGAGAVCVWTVARGV